MHLIIIKMVEDSYLPIGSNQPFPLNIGQFLNRKESPVSDSNITTARFTDEDLHFKKVSALPKFKCLEVAESRFKSSFLAPRSQTGGTSTHKQ